MVPTVSEDLKGVRFSQKQAGGYGNVGREYAEHQIDNLARREALEAYQQERARAKRQSEK